MKYIFYILLIFPIFSLANEKCFSIKDTSKRIDCILFYKKTPDSLLVLTNDFGILENRRKQRAVAYKGYLLTEKQDNEYPYLFYSKYTRNYFLIEKNMSSGDKFNSDSIFIQSGHNFDEDKMDWIYIKFSNERRDYFNFDSTDNQLGIGLYGWITNNVHNDFSIDFGTNKKFFPKFRVQDEIFYYKGNNTFSLLGRFSFYEDELGKSRSLFIISPHYRRDFSFGYLGIRANFYQYGNSSLTIYGGIPINHRINIDGSYSFGKEIEDGFFESNFYSYSFGLKIKVLHSLDLYIKKYYSHHDYYYGKRDGFLINFFFKY